MKKQQAQGKKPEYTFCRVCRINHNHGPKHKFHAKHKYALSSALEREAANISEFKSFASQRLTGGLFSSQRWCIFCDKDTSTKDTAFLSTLQHLNSKEHKKNVIDFLKEMGSNENRSKFYVQKGVLKQFINTGDQDYTPNETAASPNTNGTSAPVSPTVDPTSTEKKEDEGPKVIVPRTVVSVNGIKQNPTGWDQGERVWGGGIVKYKREGEWQPWPIDLDNESDAFDPSTLMGGAIIPGLLNPVSAHNNIVSSPPAGSTLSNGVFTHPSLATPQERKQTEYAYSAELSRVDPLPLQTGQGNVHSGATPPWMVDDSGSAIPTITPFVTLSERERRGKKQQPVRGNDRRKKQKVGANVDREKAVKQAENPRWLPNFGSVWTAGPRSETRKNFEMHAHEKPNIRVGQTTRAPPVDVGAKLAMKHRMQQQQQQQQQQQEHEM